MRTPPPARLPFPLTATPYLALCMCVFLGPYDSPARRLVNENFLPAVILEVVLYDWSRGSGYSGSYAAPGTSSSGSAERRAEAEEGGALGGAGADADARAGAGPKEGGVGGIIPIVVMDECPCPPDLLFRDGDVYEEEEEEDKDGGAAGGLTLVRRDGKMAESRHGGGGGEGEGKDGNNVFKELFTADELACDVGGLDGQLEDIVRRVLSTRSIPSEVRLGRKRSVHAIRARFF